MEKYSKLLSFLLTTSKNCGMQIKPSWDGHRWITLIDLPVLGKFGLGSSEDKNASIDMAVDHALLFVDDYLKDHPNIKLRENIGGFDYELLKDSDDSLLLKVKND